MVARLVRDEEVAGSNPVTPTGDEGPRDREILRPFGVPALLSPAGTTFVGTAPGGGRTERREHRETHCTGLREHRAARARRGAPQRTPPTRTTPE